MLSPGALTNVSPFLQTQASDGPSGAECPGPGPAALTSRDQVRFTPCACGEAPRSRTWGDNEHCPHPEAEISFWGALSSAIY